MWWTVAVDIHDPNGEDVAIEKEVEAQTSAMAIMQVLGRIWLQEGQHIHSVHCGRPHVTKRET